MLQDDADILEEAEAERDENGNLVVSEETIRELGAVDTESVRENRRLKAMVNKKSSNAKNVTINTGDVLTTYDVILGSWPANTIDIHMKRTTGSPFQEVITSRPRNGTELLAALKAMHGQYEEAQYFIQFKDNSTQQFRGSGKITIRDSRPPQQQVPYGYPPPNGAVPPQYYPPQYAPPPQPPPQPTNGHAQSPQPPPQVFVQPSPGLDMAAMFENFKQMFDMFQNVQQRFAPPPPPPPQTVAPQYPQPQLMMPPPPSPTASPAEQMAWMREIFQMFQKMQSTVMGQQTPAPAPQPQPQQPQMSAPMGPAAPPPRGYQWVWRPDFGAHVLMPEASIAPPSGPMYRRFPQGEGGERPLYAQPPTQPQRQQSPADQVRDALGVVRQTMHAVREMGSVLGQQEPAEAPIPIEQDDDSPVRIVEGSGSGKLVYDNKDGSLRPWDSILANLPSMMKWAGEQREAIQKGAEERQRREQRRSQEYVAIPVEEQRLPPPPADVPPPIESEEPTEESPWGAPTTPGNGN